MLERRHPILTLFSYDACFQINGIVNFQSNRHWSAENPMLIHKVPLHNVIVGVARVVSVTMITGSFVSEIIISHKYVVYIMITF
jgi:hypothetical protein